MLKLISILLTNGIVLFMLISCHNKTGNSKSTVNLEYENSIDSLNSYKMDISHFINSIEPGETIVEEKQMQGEEFITRENENIKVRFLLKAPCSKDGFLKTEITNNTNDTIIYISNTFLHYRESNNSWIPLVYPDNYVKNDLGYLIRFFLPSQEEYPKGKYKLQLLFRNTSKSIDYYIDKIFLSNKSN